MSKKAKAEVADESAVIITDAVLAENQAPTISSHSFTAVLRDKSFSML